MHAAISVVVSNSANIYFFHVALNMLQSLFVLLSVFFFYIASLDLASAKNGAILQLQNRCFEILNVNKALACCILHI